MIDFPDGFLLQSFWFLYVVPTPSFIVHTQFDPENYLYRENPDNKYSTITLFSMGKFFSSSQSYFKFILKLP